MEQRILLKTGESVRVSAEDALSIASLDLRFGKPEGNKECALSVWCYLTPDDLPGLRENLPEKARYLVLPRFILSRMGQPVKRGARVYYRDNDRLNLTRENLSSTPLGSPRKTRAERKLNWQPETEGTRVCNKCGAEQPLTQFAASKSSPLGRKRTCKDCVIKYNREYYNKNRRSIINHVLNYKASGEKRPRKGATWVNCGYCGEPLEKATSKARDSAKKGHNIYCSPECQKAHGRKFDTEKGAKS
jgi:hypothetical protein